MAQKRHGSENVVGWSIHRDEQAPHLAVYVVPLKDGKLNAKHFTGGKKVLSQLQTDFAKDVGLRYGLERGIEGSQAKHQTVKEFYAQVNQPIKEVHLSAQSVEPRVIEKAGLLDKVRGRGDLVEQQGRGRPADGGSAAGICPRHRKGQARRFTGP